MLVKWKVKSDVKTTITFCISFQTLPKKSKFTWLRLTKEQMLSSMCQMHCVPKEQSLAIALVR